MKVAVEEVEGCKRRLAVEAPAEVVQKEWERAYGRVQKQARLPGFPLVMHGSSSVPKEEVDRINAAGGTIKDSAGVDPKEYLPAAKLGVTKVNIDTDGRLVWTRVHREFFRDKPAEFDFRPPGKIFIEEYAKFIASRNDLLGSSGQLDDLRKSLGK